MTDETQAVETPEQRERHAGEGFPCAAGPAGQPETLDQSTGPKDASPAELALKWLREQQEANAGEVPFGVPYRYKQFRLAADELEQALTEIATIKASTSYRMRMQQESHIEIIEAEIGRLKAARDECERQYQAKVADIGQLIDDVQSVTKERDALKFTIDGHVYDREEVQATDEELNSEPKARDSSYYL